MQSGAERRLTPRFQVSAVALVVAEGCVEGERAKVLDLSVGGARLEVPFPVEFRQRIRLLLKLESGWSAPIMAMVVAANESHASVRFAATDQQTQATIEAVIATRAVDEAGHLQPVAVKPPASTVRIPSRPHPAVAAASPKQESAEPRGPSSKPGFLEKLRAIGR